MEKKEPKFGVSCYGCIRKKKENCDVCEYETYLRVPNGHRNKTDTNRLDGTEKPIVAIDTYCSDCIHYNMCEADAGFREECNYDGHGIPSLFKRVEKVCGCMEERVVKQPDMRDVVFREITETMADVHARKNHDYGNSFTLLRERYPNAILIRLFDKLNRLDTLMSGASARVDESIDDTLLDLANYAVMELVERRMEAGNNYAKKREG